MAFADMPVPAALPAADVMPSVQQEQKLTGSSAGWRAALLHSPAAIFH